MYRDGYSSIEIGRIVGLSGVHVARLIKSVADIRLPSERIKLSHSRPEVKARLSKAHSGRECPEHVKEILRQRTGDKNHNWRGGLTLNAGYLCFTASKANGIHAGRLLHDVIAEWSAGRPLADNEAVHHRDEIKLNNHPQNLRIMTKSDHARLHAIQNKLGVRR